MWKRLWRRAKQFLLRKPDRHQEQLQQAEIPSPPDAPAAPSMDLPQTETRETDALPLPETQPTVDSSPLDLPQAPEFEPRREMPDLPQDDSSFRAPVHDEPGEATPEAQDLPDIERFTIQQPSEQPPLPESQGTGKPQPANFDAVADAAEDDLSLPASRRVRVPPEFAEEGLPPPGNGFQLVGQEQQEPFQPDSNLRSNDDKPMTQNQGEQIIRALQELARTTEQVRDKQDEVVGAIQALGQELSELGTLGP